MRPSKLVVLLFLLGGGLAFGLALPHWRTVTIVFEPGGRSYQLAGETRPLPGTMQVDDDGWLRLRVINRDSVGHSAGVLGLPAQDSATVSAELCTGTHEHGQKTLVLH